MKVFSRHKLPTLIAATLFVASYTCSSALAQLPPTVWGKSVQGPGDNQYIDKGEQQTMRHPGNTTPMRPAQRMATGGVGGGGGGGGGGGYSGPYKKTPAPPKPDVSLQPIPADEPVPLPGFPPLPDRLDLPGIENTTAMTFSSAPGGGGGGGGYAPGSGGGGGMGGGGGAGPNPFQGRKQGYQHFAPGSFSGGAPNRGGGGGGMPMGGGGPAMEGGHQNYNHAAPGAFSEPKGGVGYYKCREAAPASRPVSSGDEEFASSEAGGGGGGGGGGGRGLGREPKLNDDTANGDGGAPEAPMPVQINQAATQDLSLPDDDFQLKKNKQGGAGKFASRLGRRVTNRATQMMFRGMNQFSSGSMMGGGGGGGN